MSGRWCWHLLRVLAAPVGRAVAVVRCEFFWQLERESAIRDEWWHRHRTPNEETHGPDYSRPIRP